MPSWTVSFQVTLPSRTQPARSLWNWAIMSQWVVTMKPSIRICLPTIIIRLRGPAGNSVALYIEIAPQRAKRANGRAAVSAASR